MGKPTKASNYLLMALGIVQIAGKQLALGLCGLRMQHLKALHGLILQQQVFGML